MNILFFLTPKKEVSYLYDSDSVYNALKVIRRCGFTSIPMITKGGKYKGTLTEGDFLWSYIDIHKESTIEQIKDMPVTSLKRRCQYDAVNVNANIDDLLKLVHAQNFVPIVDDRGIFIGIVTRQEVIKHYCK